MMQSTDRDMLTHALLRQQRGQPLGSPFAPAPVPQRQQPLVAGNPAPPAAAPIPQYGFETGYKAAAGMPGQGGENEWAKKLKEMLFGVPGATGSGAP
jgi:hypothetical protein